MISAGVASLRTLARSIAAGAVERLAAAEANGPLLDSRQAGELDAIDSDGRIVCFAALQSCAEVAEGR